MEILTKEQVTEIHEATLKVLEETGYMIKDRESLKIFEEAGAQVDYEKEIVKIPKDLVEKAIKTSPSKLTLYGKKDSKVELGVGNVYFMNGYGSVNVFDWKTKRRRPNTKKDLVNFARVVDKMENNAVFFNEVTPQDISTEVLDRHNAQVVLEYVECPCFFECFSLEGLRDVAEMVKAVSGEEWKEKPIGCFQVCTISPLLIGELQARLLVEIAKMGFPIVFGTLPQAGGTSPATLAGTLVVQNAEILGGLTLSQLVNTGVPFLLNNFAAIMDMRYAVFASGGPEMALMQAATAQICHYNGLLQVGTSGSTEANSLDIQAGYEKGITTLYTALAGIELIHGAVSGWVQSLLSHCLAQVVVSNEICGYVYRILDGIKVSEKTLAFDAIKEIGPSGNFLMHPHTMESFKSEHWEPSISKRISVAEWEKGGHKGVLDYAQEKVDNILNEEPVSYISESLKKEIHKIVKKAEAGGGVK